MYEKYMRHCLEKKNGGHPVKTKTGMLKVAVPESGHAILFQLVSTKHPSFQQYQLLQGVQFSFDSPASLLRFTDIIHPILFEQCRHRLLLTVEVKLNMFSTKCLPRAPELMAWQEVGVGDDPHAFGAWAYEHYDDWVKAVKKLCELPVIVLVTPRFLFPYRNFDNLESLSKSLRTTPKLGILDVEFEKDT
jgi:hypothetical protein